MNGIMVIPTGIGAEIGGHAGDGNAAAKLIASVCDTLIIHPNVVNASDINEMTENMLYVEGSTLDRFLDGEINLKRVKANKTLVVCNKVTNDIINSVSAARVTLGAEIEIMELPTPLRLIAAYDKQGKSTGSVIGWEEMVEQVDRYDFDTIAITTPIEVMKKTVEKYLTEGGVNPWGGVEAKCSKLISKALNKPVVHSPVENLDDKKYAEWFRGYDEIVDPRMAAEMVSVSYLHCILKGLHKAPRVVNKTYRWNDGINYRDINFMISPDGCIGEPHHACFKNNIPIIAVNENKTILKDYDDRIMYVQSYMEAVGMIKALETGISRESVQRPIFETVIWKA